MPNLNHVEASRMAVTWGWDRETTQEAMKQHLKSASWCTADTGSLLRIAAALEAIATLLDPDLRRELLERRRQKEAEEKAAEKAVQERIAIVDDWWTAHPELGKSYPETGVSVYYHACETVRRGHREKWLKDLFATPLTEMRWKKLFGIGEIKAKKLRDWVELNTRSEHG